jgi:hypothetical protein
VRSNVFVAKGGRRARKKLPEEQLQREEELLPLHQKRKFIVPDLLSFFAAEFKDSRQLEFELFFFF